MTAIPLSFPQAAVPPDVQPGKTIMPFDLDVVIIYINLDEKDATSSA